MDCFFHTNRFGGKQHFDFIFGFYQEFFRISRNLIVVVFFLLPGFRASSILTLFFLPGFFFSHQQEFDCIVFLSFFFLSRFWSKQQKMQLFRPKQGHYFKTKTINDFHRITQLPHKTTN